MGEKIRVAHYLNQFFARSAAKKKPTSAPDLKKVLSDQVVRCSRH